MITKVGQQILSELKSEQSMDLEDNKWSLMFKEAGTLPHFVMCIVNAIFSSISVYFVTVSFLFIATLDEQSVNLLITQPIAATIATKNNIIQFAAYLTTLYTGYRSYRYWSCHQSMKQQRQADYDNFYHEQALQIELIEELLHRHNLIDRKDA